MRTEQSDDLTRNLLRTYLQTFVPPHVNVLLTNGGPSRRDKEQAMAYIPSLTGAALFEDPAEARRLAPWLVEVAAVFAFCPGGVDVLGLRFEVRSKTREVGR